MLGLMLAPAFADSVKTALALSVHDDREALIALQARSLMCPSCPADLAPLPHPHR